MSVSYFQAKKKKKTSSAQATTQVLFLETTILSEMQQKCVTIPPTVSHKL